MNKKRYTVKHGFTLIELLIVISIIAILAALAIFGIGGVFQKSRDTRRRSDLRQYQGALENWANAHDGFYPSRVNFQSAANTLCGDLNLTDCPDDPVTVDGYQFLSNGEGNGALCFNNNACASSYWVSADLESGEWDENTDFVVCSNGKSGECNNCGDVDNCPLFCGGLEICPL